MEWKALANAVIHEGFDPELEVTYIGCERCGNRAMRVLASNQLPLTVAEHSRVTLMIFECPACGHLEMDCIGTYGLPDYLPGSVLPFAGHFLMLLVGLMERARQLDREEGLPEKPLQVPPGHEICPDCGREMVWDDPHQEMPVLVCPACLYRRLREAEQELKRLREKKPV